MIPKKNGEDKWSDKLTNEEFLQCITEKKMARKNI